MNTTRFNSDSADSVKDLTLKSEVLLKEGPNQAVKHGLHYKQPTYPLDLILLLFGKT